MRRISHFEKIGGANVAVHARLPWASLGAVLRAPPRQPLAGLGQSSSSAHGTPLAGDLSARARRLTPLPQGHQRLGYARFDSVQVWQLPRVSVEAHTAQRGTSTCLATIRRLSFTGGWRVAPHRATKRHALSARPSTWSARSEGCGRTRHGASRHRPLVSLVDRSSSTEHSALRLDAISPRRRFHALLPKTHNALGRLLRIRASNIQAFHVGTGLLKIGSFELMSIGEPGSP